MHIMDAAFAIYALQAIYKGMLDGLVVKEDRSITCK
jgi:hypothetical protein